MARHHARGKLGEFIGEAWLEKKGFTILHRNWRSGHKEIDIIGMRGSTLHLIEVKTRYNLNAGWPEESVSFAKMKLLKEAAVQYLLTGNHRTDVQFDVLSVLVNTPFVSFDFFEDVRL